VEIPAPQFDLGSTVEPTPDAAIEPASRVGRVESRSWTEFRDQSGYWRYTIRWPGGGTSSEDDKHLQTSDVIACDLKVVVNGVPIKVETSTTATVGEVVDQVLTAAGITRRGDGVEWELRTEDGRQLTHLVGDGDLVDGETTLFLDPEVGGGGDGESVEATIVESSDSSQIGRTGRVPLEALGAAGERGEESHADSPGVPGPPDGWQGEPPAEGTRRALILGVIDNFAMRLISGVGGKATKRSCLELADAIEEALIRVVDQGATPESGSPASVAMDTLDGMKIPRTREGAILTISDRVTALADELVEYRRDAIGAGNEFDRISIPRSTGATGEPGTPRTLTLTERAEICIRRVLAGEESKRLLASTVDGQQKAIDKIRAEGKVKPGTRELVIVLEDVSDADTPPEYRFIELEDQDGAGVGSFPMRPSSRTPFLEITIPYGRDDAWVSEVAYQAAGAATRPLLEDHPDYVFPAERVRDAVAELLSDFGIPRACVDCAEEQLGHGAKEVDGRRDATIKQLEADVERFLREREEARSGESRFAEERDCAFALLRWLLPVTVAKRID